MKVEPGWRIPLHTAAGAVLVLLGGLVILGWCIESAPLVRVGRHFPPMVLNTAICFVLTGWAVLADPGDAPAYRRITTAAGGLVSAIALLVLAQHAFHVDLGIDWRSLHRWLGSGLADPGRMSPATAVGFLAAGGALLAAPRVSGPRLRAMVRALTAVVGLAGVLGLAGYLVGAHLLFRQYLFAGVAVHTAAGMIVLAVGMHAVFRRMPWSRAAAFSREDDRIAFLGALVMSAVTLAAGITMFAVLADRAQELVRGDLITSLRDRADVFQDLVAFRESNARIAATRPAAARNLRVIGAGKDDGSNLANLQAAVDSFVKEGFSAIAYADNNGKVIAQAGRFTGVLEMVVQLATADRADLIWADGFMLRHRLPVYDAGVPVGEVRTEQPMPVLTRMSQSPPGRGETWDMGICTLRFDSLQCFPQRLNNMVFATGLTSVTGEPLPMVRALRGESGSTVTRDYRRQNVLAAYGPIGELGLGMVVKVDSAEVLAPVREQLLVAAGVLLLFVAAGTLLLRLQVRPLATRVVEAKAELERRGALLEAANKELEAFSYSVSHDLRAPLRHIDGFGRMLEEEAAGALNPEAQRHLGVIRESVGRMGQLIDDLLAFSKVGRLELQRAQIDMEEMARAVAAEEAARAGEQRRIDWQIGALEPAQGDRATLRQVWVNLLANAVKYTRKKSEARIEIGCRRNGVETEYWIKDNGAGFDMKYAGKLWGVFQRLHAQQDYEGTGIGLANVRRIVARHGGRTWAEGRLGAGASFHFTLPNQTQGGI